MNWKLTLRASHGGVLGTATVEAEQGVTLGDLVNNPGAADVANEEITEGDRLEIELADDD